MPCSSAISVTERTGYIGRVRTEAPEVYKATLVAPAPAVAGGKYGAQIGFRSGAHLAHDLPAMAEGDQRRDADDAKLACGLRPLVRVDLPHVDAAFVLGLQALDYGSHPPARRTPRRPDIHDKRSGV